MKDLTHMPEGWTLSRCIVMPAGADARIHVEWVDTDGLVLDAGWVTVASAIDGSDLVELIPGHCRYSFSDVSVIPKAVRGGRRRPVFDSDVNTTLPYVDPIQKIQRDNARRIGLMEKKFQKQLEALGKGSVAQEPSTAPSSPQKKRPEEPPESQEGTDDKRGTSTEEDGAE